MDDRARNSGHLMLITPERVFYAGLLGRPRERCPGAFHIYVALRGGLWLTTADGREAYGELVAVAPNMRHTIASDHRSAICLVIEPESVPHAGFAEIWEKRLQGIERDLFAHRIRAAYETLLTQACRDDIDSAAFDEMCFGEALPRRALDPRVVRAMVTSANSRASRSRRRAVRRKPAFPPRASCICSSRRPGFPSVPSAPEARAASAALRQPGPQSRASRAGHRLSDSTHFSHSIRRFYGLKPRAIFSGSRDLAIYSSGRTDSALTQEAG